jgi:hypothetical protein
MFIFCFDTFRQQKILMQLASAAGDVPALLVGEEIYRDAEYKPSCNRQRVHEIAPEVEPPSASCKSATPMADANFSLCCFSCAFPMPEEVT